MYETALPTALGKRMLQQILM